MVNFNHYCIYERVLDISVENRYDLFMIKDLWLNYKVANSIFNYNVKAYFFNNHINMNDYFSRIYKLYSFNFVKFNNNNNQVSSSSTTSKLESNVRDVYFESQNFTHSLSFEVVWAFCPSSVIVSILSPSLNLLYSLDDTLDPEYTIKVIGHQWYWSYEFDNWVDFKPLTYDWYFSSLLRYIDKLLEKSPVDDLWSIYEEEDPEYLFKLFEFDQIDWLIPFAPDDRYVEFVSFKFDSI